MEEDVAGQRFMAGTVREMSITSSFSENFAVFRERTGVLTIITPTQGHLAQTQAAAETVIRSNYSIPPSHGARIVATGMDDSDLHADWTAELDEMRSRIAEMPKSLRQKLEDRQVTQALFF